MDVDAVVYNLKRYYSEFENIEVGFNNEIGNKYISIVSKDGDIIVFDEDFHLLIRDVFEKIEIYCNVIKNVVVKVFIKSGV